jgi:hypothetical protein
MFRSPVHVRLHIFAHAMWKLNRNYFAAHLSPAPRHRSLPKTTHFTTFFDTHVYNRAGAAVVTALTGVNLYAASFLIPLSVVFYTAQGGIMAAFISSWGHVGIIYIAMLIFVWKIYAGPSDLGSTDKVSLLVSASELRARKQQTQKLPLLCML